MPTVMRIGPYCFHFYSRENNEPPHIHVARHNWEARFWLRLVSLASNRGFSHAELNRIEKLVEEHCQNCWTRIFNSMVNEATNETAATRCWIEDRRVCLELADGRRLRFPAAKYPLLASAPQPLLEKVVLRLDGLALRWEELDEDIWVDDAVCGRFPRRQIVAA